MIASQLVELTSLVPAAPMPAGPGPLNAQLSVPSDFQHARAENEADAGRRVFDQRVGPRQRQDVGLGVEAQVGGDAGRQRLAADREVAGAGLVAADVGIDPVDQPAPFSALDLERAHEGHLQVFDQVLRIHVERWPARTAGKLRCSADTGEPAVDRRAEAQVVRLHLSLRASDCDSQRESSYG